MASTIAEIIVLTAWENNNNNNNNNNNKEKENYQESEKSFQSQVLTVTCETSLKLLGFFIPLCKHT